MSSIVRNSLRGRGTSATFFTQLAAFRSESAARLLRGRALWQRTMALAAIAMMQATAATAASAGSNLPWNAPLTNLLNNLTGPTARAVVGLGVAICGVIWMMKRHEEGAGRLGQAVVGGALVFGAQVFTSTIGFAGAVI